MAVPQLHIPSLYKVIFSTVDPVFAVGGTLTIHFAPARFLTSMSASSIYTPDKQIIMNQLAAVYFFQAFNQATVLRLTSELGVWQAVEAGMAICDVMHLGASWAAMGTENFWNPLKWRGDDWVNLGILYGVFAVRVAFLMGMGIDKSRVGSKRL